MSSIAERLAGKVAVVSGAGQGLGRAIAGVLGDAGASVALLGRTESTQSRRLARCVLAAQRHSPSDVT